MATVSVPNCLTAEQVGQSVGGFSEFGVGVGYTSQPAHSEGLELSDYLFSFVVPHTRLMQSDTYSTIMHLIHDNLKPEVYSEPFPFGSAVVGNVTNPISATSTAPILSWRTDHAGRSYRGRSYVPGASEEQVTDDAPDSTTLGIMADVITALIAIGATLDIPGLAVVSKKLGTFRVIFEGIARTIIGTQRRRKKGVGE